MIINSISSILIVLCLIFTEICAIALVLNRVFGPYILEFSTYEMAFYETIFVYFFGDFKIQEKMLKQNMLLSFALIAVVFLSLFYGSVAMFNSVLYEKYRLVSTKLRMQGEK